MGVQARIYEEDVQALLARFRGGGFSMVQGLTSEDWVILMALHDHWEHIAKHSRQADRNDYYIFRARQILYDEGFDPAMVLNLEMSINDLGLGFREYCQHRAKQGKSNV